MLPKTSEIISKKFSAAGSLLRAELTNNKEAHAQETSKKGLTKQFKQVNLIKR
jgi:hypothetical protein